MQDCEYCGEPAEDELCEGCIEDSRIEAMQSEQENFDIYGGDPLDETTWHGSPPDQITWADISKMEE